MDFIEQWFGISPDGGSGATEMLYVLVAALVVALFVLWRVAPRYNRASPRRDN
jgi:hypothetical protein